MSVPWGPRATLPLRTVWRAGPLGVLGPPPAGPRGAAGPEQAWPLFCSATHLGTRRTTRLSARTPAAPSDENPVI